MREGYAKDITVLPFADFAMLNPAKRALKNYEEIIVFDFTCSN